MASHTYRYTNLGIDQGDLRNCVPGDPTVDMRIPDSVVDVTVDDSSKPDLDAYMATIGFSYLSQDPGSSALLRVVHDAVVDSDGLGHQHVIRKSFAATGAGADDVVVYNANAPLDFRVVDCHLLLSTIVALSTATLRDASGGGGNALSSDLITAVAGTVRNNGQATGTVAAGGTLALRRSSGNTVGELIVTIQRI